MAEREREREREKCVAARLSEWNMPRTDLSMSRSGAGRAEYGTVAVRKRHGAARTEPPVMVFGSRSRVHLVMDDFD